MASTNKLDFTLSFVGVETLDADDAPFSLVANNRDITVNSLKTNGSLNATSTPKVEKAPAVKLVTLAGSIVTIDLTAAEISGGRTEDMSAKKLVAFEISAPSTNTGDVTIEPGATNGYDLFGASGLLVFSPGQVLKSIISGAASSRDAVGASDKTIDISGTSGDLLYVVLYFGGT